MASAPLESNLADLFTKQAPKMPDGGKKFFVEAAPWLALIGGIWTLLSALFLWNWAHVANNAINFANDLCNSYSLNTTACSSIATSRLTLWIWLSIIFLIVQGVIYLLAFTGLRDRKKAGWNYAYLAELVAVAYAVLSLFNGYGGVFSLVWSLIVAAVVFWVLFQIRGSYKTVANKSDAPKPPSNT